MVNLANRHSLCGGELLKCRNLRFDQCTIHFPISISLRVAGAADLEGLQIISGSQQPLIFIMAPHQGANKANERYKSEIHLVIGSPPRCLLRVQP